MGRVTRVIQQQLSTPFETLEECTKDARKKNGFRRSLLNKCQDEFQKDDIYLEWKERHKAFTETKATLAERDAAKQEEEFNFERMQLKKHMLGNVKFIGELYERRASVERSEAPSKARRRAKRGASERSERRAK